MLSELLDHQLNHEEAPSAHRTNGSVNIVSEERHGMRKVRRQSEAVRARPSGRAITP